MTKNRQTIAITGASGFVGQYLVNHFSKQGWKVVALVRDIEKARTLGFASDTEYREYDISQTLDLSLLAGVDYVVHAAYVKHGDTTANALGTNVDGAKRLIESSNTSGVKRLLFISSMSAHDKATSLYGRQKLAIESLFTKQDAIILKCGLIIGDGGIVREMSEFMKSKHAVPLIDGGKQPLQIVSIHDLAAVIERALNSNLTGTFIIATPKVYSYKEFYVRLARHLNIKVLYVPVPYVLLKIAFKAASLLGIKLGVGEDNLEGLKMLRSMPSQTDLQTIGIKLRSLDEALEGF